MPDTVLITGISGYIALHLAHDLLNQGYAVRGTVRSLERADEVRTALQEAGADVTALSFAETDLMRDDGWGEAVAGCRYVQHVASPFPIRQPSDREALVPVARAGSLRVLNAARAADVERIVVTSSIVAMMYRANRPQQVTFREDDWTDPEWPELTAYIVSKTRAERTVWDWADEHGWRDRLAVVNPGFVLGPPLNDRMGTSLKTIKLLIEGAYPAVPRVHFSIVDVRDLAALHRAAMTVPAAAGRRLIGANQTLSLADMGRILKEALPERASKIPTVQLPGFVIRLIALFDRSLRTVLPDLGIAPQAQSGYVSDLTGIHFRPARDSVRDTGQALIERGMV